MPTHGTNTCYSKGCRRNECREAHRKYERDRTRSIRRERMGLEARPEKYVSADQTREHIRFLRSKGLGLSSIAAKTGFNRRYIKTLSMESKKKVLASTEKKILAVPAIPILPGHFLDSKEARKLVDEMLAIGLKRTEIGEMVIGHYVQHFEIRNHIRLSRLQKIREVHRRVMAGHRD